jgi:glycosyltransferase 2 family protein
MSKKIKNIIQYVFFLGLGIFLAWWSIKDLTAAEKIDIKNALKSINYSLVPPVLALLWLSHFVRGLRWKLLIDSLGYNVQRKNTFFAVLIGYFTNQALPRMGEVIKCTVLSRHEQVPIDKLIGTIILERIIDAICLLLVFGITLLIQPHLYAQIMDAIFTKPKTSSADNNIGKWVFYIVVAIGIVTFIGWMIIKKKTLPELLKIIKKAGSSIWQGVSAVRYLKKKGQFILLTFIIWAVYLFGGYIGFLAFQETKQYGIPAAFTVLSTGSIGMIATPGGIGAYPIMVQQGMMLYGLSAAIALAYGWALWLAQVAATSIGGVVSFVAIPFFNKKKEIEKV